MEFGLFHSAHVPRRADPDEQRRAEHQRLLDEIAIGEAADRSGFKYLWFTEHHFLDEYSHISASEVFMSFVAARTERVHLGSGIWNLTPPVNPPARVAERVAMLDHLSGGRFEFGTGRGSSSTEYTGFEIPDGPTTRSMHDEALAEILRMMKETVYPGFDGKHFSMPARTVLPKPWTVPHPPLWLACGNPESFEKAGRLGMGALCFTIGPPDVLAPLIEVYKNAVAHAEPIGEYVNNNVACVTRLLCFDNGDEARRRMTEVGSGRYQSLVFRYLDSFPRPEGLPAWPELVPEPDLASIEGQVAAGVLTGGDPDDCANAVQRYVDIGCDQLIFGQLNNLLTGDEGLRSVETFGHHVIGRFDLEAEHSTTRQRRRQWEESGQI